MQTRKHIPLNDDRAQIKSVLEPTSLAQNESVKVSKYPLSRENPKTKYPSSIHKCLTNWSWPIIDST